MQSPDPRKSDDLSDLRWLELASVRRDVGLGHLLDQLADLARDRRASWPLTTVACLTITSAGSHEHEAS
jgi:hypothetical protein